MAALVTMVLAGGIVLGGAVSASADSIQLCKGYSGCAALGMTNHGYSTANSKSYWRMYGGHNCTNYAAYMMVRAGHANSRPFSTSGDAWGWGHGSKRVNGTPKVGSVAWWDGDGKDNKGHVAYVEAVLSKTSIIVSEDSWGGEFDWRVISETSGGWPDGFIHYKDESGDGTVPEWRSSPQGFSVFTASWQQISPEYLKPGGTFWLQLKYQNTGTATWRGVTLGIPSGASPVVVGDRVAVQQQESVAPGEWATFSVPVTIPADSRDGEILSTTFQPVASGVGWLRFGRSTADLRVDSRDLFLASPTPWITGTAEQSQVLTANLGTWNPSPAVSVDWLRNGEPIPGAHGLSYTLRDADVGTSVSVRVEGVASGFVPTTRDSSSVWVASKFDNALSAGESLGRSDQLVSSNGVWRAVQTSSGKLAVVNRFTGKSAWSSGRVGSVTTKLRRDGNLVSYNRAGKPVWSTGTSKAVEAVITNSGKLVLRSATSRIRWNSANASR